MGVDPEKDISSQLRAVVWQVMIAQGPVYVRLRSSVPGSCSEQQYATDYIGIFLLKISWAAPMSCSTILHQHQSEYQDFNDELGLNRTSQALDRSTPR